MHSTVPTFERLAAGAMARWVAQCRDDGATPDDYEAVLSPLYAWMHALTQRSEHTLVSAGAGASARAWVALTAERPGARCARSRSAPATAPRSAASTALGIGPLRADLSGAALRRGGLHGHARGAPRLGLAAPRT